MGDSNVTPIDRHAAALADIRQIHETNLTLRSECDRLQRLLTAEQDKTTYLLQQVAEHKRGEGIFMRKLVAICKTVGNIGLLTDEAKLLAQQAEQLLPSEQTEEEQRLDDQAAADILARLPQNGTASLTPQS